MYGIWSEILPWGLPQNNMLPLPLCDISKDKIYVFYSDRPKTQPFFPPLEIFSEPSSSYYIIYFLWKKGVLFYHVNTDSTSTQIIFIIEEDRIVGSYCPEVTHITIRPELLLLPTCR